MSGTSRERMVEAAFALFETQGYDATTVEAIVEAAGVSRSTFFRVVGSKEEAIFPQHVEVRERIAARLTTATAQTVVLAVGEATALVLEHYLAEGDLARARYRLTRSVPALREREVASMLGYQRLFRDEVRRRFTGADADLRAELLAAAVVTAHNVVLRRWLRGESDASEARGQLEHAMGIVLANAGQGETAGDGTTVVVLRSGQSMEEVLPGLRRVLGASPQG